METQEPGGAESREKIVKSEAEWREQLTEEQFHVLREEGTEPAFANAYWDNKAEGLYRCAACGAPLFDSETKYESGTGWPSFWRPVAMDRVHLERDTKIPWEVRTEVECARCNSHLGHVFDDGPDPTGKRYCMNSAALDFEPRE